MSKVTIPFLRFNRAPSGTVYLMQSRGNPRLFKVGFTKRKTKERRFELNRVAGDDMAIVATVQLPWARACEALLLRRLRLARFVVATGAAQNGSGLDGASPLRRSKKNYSAQHLQCAAWHG